MTTIIDHVDPHTLVLSETPTDPAMPLVIEVVGRPVTWVPVIVIPAPRRQLELSAVTTSDLPPHETDPVAERAWEVVAALSARRDETLAELPEVPHYVGPRLRLPTYAERWRHVGGHRAVESTSLSQIFTPLARAWLAVGVGAAMMIIAGILNII